MSRATQSFKTGMSYIGGGEVPSYSLEYLTPSPGHPVGSHETIVVPYIEIGRSSQCAVRLSEEVGTVSRFHASLLRRGKSFFINNLSKSNPTLVNDEPIREETELANGDEIQFSYEGPRIRFNVTPTGAAPLGITKRVNLVVNQAVRPYRTTIFSLIALLLVGSAVTVFFIYQLNQETDTLAGQTEKLQSKNASLSDSLAIVIRANDELKQKILADKQQMEAQLQSTIAELKAKQQEVKIVEVEKAPPPNPEELVAKAIADVKGSVFYMGIKNVKAEIDGEVLINEPFPENCHCTGFLLDDGRFLTARHCIEIFLYESNELNLLLSLGGNVTYNFYAISSDEKTRFDFTNHEFTVNNTTDYFEEDEYNGQEVMLRKARAYDGTDWAFFQTDSKGAIQADPELSGTLKSGTELHCLGYTYGNTFQKFDTQEGLEVLYSKASVAKDNLDNNTIVVSGYGFDNGNSGGPLFVIRNGVAKAIAIVSAGYMNPSTGRDDALGSVVPIKNVSTN